MSQECEFANLVLGAVEPDAAIDLPQVVYDADGDCIEFIASNEDFEAVRVNSMLTLYVGRQSQEIAGSLIKGVHSIIKAILDEYPGFKLDVRGGKLRLEHTFTAKLWSSEDDDDTVDVYLKLREVAEKTKAQVELCEV